MLPIPLRSRIPRGDCHHLQGNACATNKLYLLLEIWKGYAAMSRELQPIQSSFLGFCNRTILRMPKPFSSESPCSGLLGVRDTWAWQYHHLTVNHLIHIFVPHVQGCVLPLGSRVSQWITIFLSQNSCLSFLIKGHLPPWGWFSYLSILSQAVLPSHLTSPPSSRACCLNTHHWCGSVRSMGDVICL